MTPELAAQWAPTIVTAAFVVGIAFVADSNIKRHETVLTDLQKRMQDVEKEVAVLKATKE